jgi:hypothetical protein
MTEQIKENPFCVISIATYGENEMHDIQTNSGWSKNPYGDGYAVVSDEMVQDILETKGYCDIVLNDDGTEVVSFTARDIPEPEAVKAEPTTGDILDALLGVE